MCLSVSTSVCVCVRVHARFMRATKKERGTEEGKHVLGLHFALSPHSEDWERVRLLKLSSSLRHALINHFVITHVSR